MATWEDNICCFQLGMRSKTSDAAVVHDLRSLWYCCWKLLVRLEGTYGAAAGKVAVLSNGREYIDAIGGAVMTPQPKPALQWLLRIEELRIVESTNDAERNATTHDVLRLEIIGFGCEKRVGEVSWEKMVVKLGVCW
ncbi:hypothetical protein H0E87_004931 [Populus deltoides]|uniref:Uncharacterized protein n=1 Tax=Populus deltoides TaxID=3696 RepID=A0A8T2ZIW2_POPDE|nr:hypothetical protein H0E87_004931 [Populus deltoides]